MTANSVLKLARSFLKDVGSPYRWNTPGLMPFVDLAQRSVVALRPDALIATDGTLITLSDVSGGRESTDLDLAEKWQEPMAHIVAAYAYLTDAKDSTDRGRASSHMALFGSTVRQA